MGIEGYNYDPPYPCENAPEVIHIYQNSAGTLSLPEIEHDDGATYRLDVYDMKPNEAIFTIDTSYVPGAPPEFTYTADNTFRAGLWVAKLYVLDISGNIVASADHYLQIEQTSRAGTTLYGPLTIAEVRMELWDECPDMNFLIDRLEFPDHQVIRCMQRPVRVWNETTPITRRYTTENFPYHETWLDATVGYLMVSIANWYFRNHLQYQSRAGVIDDMDKWKVYLQLGNQKIDAYKGKVDELKYAEELRKGGRSWV